MEKDNSSVIVSTFKRKGGEGDYTKIIDTNNQGMYLQYFPDLKENEHALIFYFKGESNWLLLTNKRILTNHNGEQYVISNQDIFGVTPAMQEEFKDGVRNKTDFTRLILKDSSNKSYLLHVEKGQPYEGLYQALHFLATKK